jgi:hypothetical protein
MGEDLCFPIAALPRYLWAIKTASATFSAQFTPWRLYANLNGASELPHLEKSQDAGHRSDLRVMQKSDLVVDLASPAVTHTTEASFHCNSDSVSVLLSPPADLHTFIDSSFFFPPEGYIEQPASS